MKIINFEEAKAGMRSKEKTVKHLPEADTRAMKLKMEYDEMVRFFEQWYDEHVVGQDENGRWVYKD